MRTLSKLYSIALEEYKSDKHYQTTGLCYLIGNLADTNKISHPEHKKISNSLRKNRPTTKLHPEFVFYPYGAYWWPRVDSKSRIQFLEKMIKYVDRPWYVRLWDRLK